MKVYSDTLTTSDLYRAARIAHVNLDASRLPGNVRVRANGWTVTMGGSSPYTSQAYDGKAATWDEWGVWMNELFDTDPHARIGPYDGAEDFADQTQAAMSYMRQKGMKAPWLNLR